MLIKTKKRAWGLKIWKEDCELRKNFDEEDEMGGFQRVRKRRPKNPDEGRQSGRRKKRTHEKQPIKPIALSGPVSGMVEKPVEKPIVPISETQKTPAMPKTPQSIPQKIDSGVKETKVPPKQETDLQQKARELRERFNRIKKGG